MRSSFFMTTVLTLVLGSTGSVVAGGGRTNGPVVSQDVAAKVATLTRSLSSPNANDRACAALALGELREGASSAVAALVALLGDTTRVHHLECADSKWRNDNDTSGTIGEFAAVALSQVGPTGLDALAGATLDMNAAVREHATFGLGLTSSDRAVEPLLHVLGDGESAVRAKAAWSLGLVGDQRSVEPLSSTLRDTSADVRSQAAWALGLKGDRRAVEPLTGALGDESERVREQAAWALGLRQDRRAVDGLVERLGSDSVKVQRQAAWALGMIADRRASAPLTAALKSNDPEIRKTAAWALGMIGLRGGDGE